MVKRMLIDATHPEETRVVVLDGTRLDEFDVETSTKKQIKGNIYLAKVVRVEPSLQAAFVDYGGNRHGFLAFAEIHPDYYQIPVADRERLMAEAARHEEEEDRRERERHRRREQSHANPGSAASISEGDSTAAASGDDAPSAGPASEAQFDLLGHEATDTAGSAHDDHHHDHDHDHDHDHSHDHDHGDDAGEDTLPLAFMPPAISAPMSSDDADETEESEAAAERAAESVVAEQTDAAAQTEAEAPVAPVEVHAETGPATEGENGGGAEPAPPKPTVETIGGEDPEDEEDEESDKQRRRFVASRHYKIQEVIKRRQIMLVQVVKEERGNKGAALTTYLSLAGRYCVLMPNSARGGGVSRKITSAQDRRRLKQIVGDLELPRAMAVILRTAGAERSKPEIKRDYEYLQRTWNNIREVTMQSRAPALIHEEASLIKRAIRDIYSRDIEEVWVDGDEGYKTAKDFMRMLTPSHAKKVQRYKDDLIPLYHRYQVESQMETINSPSVQLRSGGSIVFNQTEALVAIDVNSGRATRERHIEETAYKTNLEAAEEIARQLRLRDLAGLVVIDFIDMEDNRNNHSVERRLKEALKVDRARIQVGRISHFGLLELSRQRLRPSLIETNFRVCHHCVGTGLLRSTESAAVHTLRMIEEEGVKRRSSELTVTANPEVAIYLLNYKREMLAAADARYGLKVYILGDPTLVAPNLRIDRVKSTRHDEHGELIAAPPPRELAPPPIEIDEADDVEDEDEDEAVETVREETRAPRADHQRQSERRPDRGGERHSGERPGGERPGGEREDSEAGRKRKRRRRRRGGRTDGPQPSQQVEGGAPQPTVEAHVPEAVNAGDEGDIRPEGQVGHQEQNGEGGSDSEGRRGRRRGRRGGRRRRRGGENGGEHREGHGAPHGDGEAHVGALDTPFPADRTHPAVPHVHPDETFEPARVVTPSVEQENAEPQGNGERKGFFRGLFGRRNESQPEERVEVPPSPIAAPHVVAAPPPPRVVAAPPPPPPPPPRVVAAPPPPPPPVEDVPAGPPRRGWWKQPDSKTE